MPQKYPGRYQEGRQIHQLAVHISLKTLTSDTHVEVLTTKGWGVKAVMLATSLEVKWLRRHTPNAGGLGSTPGQGTNYHTLHVQLRPSTAK